MPRMGRGGTRAASEGDGLARARSCEPTSTRSGRGDGGCAWRANRRRHGNEPNRCAESIPHSFRAIIAIEQVINAAIEREDFAPFEEMLCVLSKPYEDQDDFAAYAAPPQPTERVLQTFCGT